MEISASDRELLAVMREYFAAKAELDTLKKQLEAAPQASDAAIDPRRLGSFHPSGGSGSAVSAH
ncbi:hypothetical protein [Sinorhizobium fredii]|uniref:hypothetical protein n=1 Tax=Rhizobium fredii TaxID=380 RepID=UPI0004AD23D6|nr:hypothetical protein [Sinorhizobium fredii]